MAIKLSVSENGFCVIDSGRVITSRANKVNSSIFQSVQRGIDEVKNIDYVGSLVVEVGDKVIAAKLQDIATPRREDVSLLKPIWNVVNTLKSSVSFVYNPNPVVNNVKLQTKKIDVSSFDMGVS